MKKMNLGSKRKLEYPHVDSKKECETDLEESKNMWRKLSVIVRTGSIRRRRGQKLDEITKIASKNSLHPPEIPTEIEIKLQEFLKFELTYLAELEMMVKVLVDMEGSKTDRDHPVPLPDQLKGGRDKYVASNINQIHRLHKGIITAGVKEYLRDPRLLRDLFSHNEDEMKKLYGKFLTAQKGVNILVKNNISFFKKLQKRAGHEQNLLELLNKPNCHITRYFLFFHELEKIASKNDNYIDAALYKEMSEVTKGINVTINNMMPVVRVSELPVEVDLHSQGVLVKQGALRIRMESLAAKTPQVRRKSSVAGSRLSLGAPMLGNLMAKLSPRSKTEPGHVFLFKQSVVVCQNKGRTGLFGVDEEELRFWARIGMNKLEVTLLVSISPFCARW